VKNGVRFMSAENFKNNAEGWLSYAKIAALVAAGGWAYYQWDVSLFPKERWDQSVRASAARVDLSLNKPTFRVGSLIHAEAQDIDLLETENATRQTDGTPTLISVTVPLRNDKPFPIAVAVKAAKLREALVPTAGQGLKWSDPVALDIEALLNIASDDTRVVETGSDLILSGQVVRAVSWCCDDRGTKPVKMVELVIDLSLQSIDGTTSEVIEGTTKTRKLRFLSVLTEGSNRAATGKPTGVDNLLGSSKPKFRLAGRGHAKSTPNLKRFEIC